MGIRAEEAKNLHFFQKTVEASLSEMNLLVPVLIDH